MKKVFLIFVFLSSITFVHSQDLKGKFFIGGSIGFENTSGNSDVNGTDLNNPNAYGYYSISSSFGYYLKSNLAIGLQMGYSSNTYNFLNYDVESNGNKDTIILSPSKATSQGFSIAPLLRYTIPIIENVEFNINVTFSYVYVKNTQNQGDASGNIYTSYIVTFDNYSQYTIGINFNPGFQWLVKNNIALLGSFGSLSYTHYKTTTIGEINYPSSTTNTNDFHLSLTTGFSLGATFYFGGIKDPIENRKYYK